MLKGIHIKKYLITHHIQLGDLAVLFINIFFQNLGKLFLFNYKQQWFFFN